jgi:chromosome segregation ATPase
LLKDALDQSTVLKAANQALRDEAATYQRRLEKTLEHLRIAGSNASKARTDADAAEATASNLSQSLQSVHFIVSETKRVSVSLQKEQQVLQHTVASVENKLLGMEAKIAASNKEISNLKAQKTSLQADIQKEKESRKALETTIKMQSRDLEELKREQAEHLAIEDARKERAWKIERECLHAQNLLLEATENQTKSEQTQEMLNERIFTLHELNQSLHEQMKQLAESSQQDIKRLSQALFESKKETQHLLIKIEAKEEEIKRVRLEKLTSEQLVSELKSHLLRYEGRINELSAITANSQPAQDVDGTVSSSQLTTNDFNIENVNSSKFADKENDSNSSNNVTIGNLCAICFKPSVGIMKTCQCGTSSCTMRAHITCVNRINPGPSVSHPGTPAQRMPIVLCGYIHKTPLSSRTSHSSLLGSRSANKRN